MVKSAQTGVNGKVDRVLLILLHSLVDFYLAKARDSY